MPAHICASVTPLYSHSLILILSVFTGCVSFCGESWKDKIINARFDYGINKLRSNKILKYGAAAGIQDLCQTS